MFDISQDIHSLSKFKRNTAAFVKQMRRNGHPLVLTVNGKAELVVQDAKSYQKLLELVDRFETIEAIREAMKDIEEGRSRGLEDFKQEVRKKYGLSS
ncbi:MAG TPA: type II toxin-antitoxin system Phd/YefM family antitoxin [Gemmataceae bacterium]|nr:type II toxin-antitoxin system Phd/YefM family antitoxin [Gemmataceae bacterium]